MIEQNGFLSAGLFGGALVLLERRPVLAGALFGLLTYKPHLGLLVPIVLIADWHKLQTIFGLVRALGPTRVAGLDRAADDHARPAAGVALLWHGRAAFDVKVRGARHCCATGDALSLHLRTRGAGGAVRLPVQTRASRWIPAE